MKRVLCLVIATVILSNLSGCAMLGNTALFDRSEYMERWTGDLSSFHEVFSKYKHDDQAVFCYSESVFFVFLKYGNEINIIRCEPDGKVLSSIVVVPSIDHTEFNSLISLRDVIDSDPNGVYLFLYTGRDDLPKVSNHFSTDGYFISISYNSDDLVSSVSYVSVFPEQMDR